MIQDRLNHRDTKAPSWDLLCALCASVVNLRMKLLRVPLLLFAVPAVFVAFATAWHGALVLERDALAAGQIWQLWTGHWVHFSVSHLLWNFVVLLAAGTWLERVRPGALLKFALGATPLISLAILATEPRLQTYGGLSALATGAVVLLGLHQLRTPDAPRLLWAGVLALVALKCAGDLLHLGPGFARYNESSVRTSITAHAAGAIAAALQFAAGRWRKWRPNHAVGT